MRYLPRIADEILKEKLKYKGAVLIEGPKWCGKTSTAARVSKSVLNLANQNVYDEAKIVSQVNPVVLLEGENPRLIDEWQEIPRLWDIVRNEVDERQNSGQFIMTGSAMPIDRKEIRHSGTGRISRMTMRTMSLWESQDSTGEISLSKLFVGDEKQIGHNKLLMQDIAFLICRGGWPMSVLMSPNISLKLAQDYYEAVINFDVVRYPEKRRSPYLAANILRAYARHIGYQSPLTTINKDVNGNDKVHDITTIESYLGMFHDIFVIEEMRSWNPNLRSKTTIRSSKTRYFMDPSIGCASLAIGPQDLMNDLKSLGMYFENLCVRDLRIYAQSIDGDIYHYRDANGLECDCIVHLRNGNYGLVEIKLGGEDMVEHAVKTLNKLHSKLDFDKMKEPSFMMVLTAVGDYAFKRPDGIWVVPIGCLRN